MGDDVHGGRDGPSTGESRDLAASTDAAGSHVTEDRVDRNPEEVLTHPGHSGVPFTRLSRAELREHYGPIRTYFKRREAHYAGFQRRLSQAWIPRTYDQYLATALTRALVVAALGIAVGVLAGAGIYGGTALGWLPRPLPVVGLPARSAAAVVAGIGTAVGVVGAVGYWLWKRVVHVRLRISRRRREIRYTLPHAVTFMYALARADVSFDEEELSLMLCKVVAASDSRRNELDFERGRHCFEVDTVWETDDVCIRGSMSFGLQPSKRRPQE